MSAPEHRRPAAGVGAGVMVAFDGSPAARRALEHAAGLVGIGDTIAVVNVIPTQSISARLQTVRDAQRDHQQHLLSEAKALLGRHRIEAALVAAVGDPVTEILAAAERRGAAILVVGSSGGTRGRLVHGSVTDRLVRRATGDVLVVH